MTVKVSKKITIREPTFVSSQPTIVDDTIAEFQFPRELQRNWIQQMDFRFLLILLSTAILEVGLIILLTAAFKATSRPVNVVKIQKQYARLLLKDETTSNFSALESTKSESFRKPLIDENELTADDLAISEGESPLEAMERVAVTNITPTVPAEYRGSTLADRKSSRTDENTFASALTREVNEKGLLQYIIRGDNSSLSEELEGVFSSGDDNSRVIQESISRLKIADFKSSGSAPNFVDAEKLEVLNKLKGSTKSVSVDEELSSLNQLNKITISSAEKITAIDIVEETKLNKKEKKSQARSPEHITAILLSHNRAIQDCFKHAIKKDPNLKGKIEVRISVDPKGHVNNVQILESTIASESMLRCITNRIRRWRDFGECDVSLGTLSYRQSYVFGY
ncbi:hypothetical protein B6I21_08375 [candidate division KSB1 bacterium 4572_119]|nr:MAG: hypothetical protein B6I21_08375 [candidate division KSB1 bacterium 4572_119]